MPLCPHNSPAPINRIGETLIRGLPSQPKWSSTIAVTTWPVITAANHDNEPIRGTMISELVTITAPIVPPDHIQNGIPDGDIVNFGGKFPVTAHTTAMVSVPAKNEIIAA